jgi:purine-binding chemotaxis protein CheW
MNVEGGGIDWGAVKERLHRSQLALEKALNPDPEQIEAAFRDRARQLAQRHAHTHSPSTPFRVLVFALGKEHYGLDLGVVVELLPFTNCTRVPGAPAQLLGVTNVHGEIRSVIDLRHLLELPDEERNSPGYILLIRHQDCEVGLRVDGIEKIRAVSPEDLLVLSDDAARPSFRCLRGLTPDMLRILSTETLFAHPIFNQNSI